MAKDKEGAEGATTVQEPPQVPQVPEWEKWLEKPNLTASLSAEGRLLLRDLHELLHSSPDAVRPVTGTTIFAAMAEIVRDVLTADGTLPQRERKTAAQQFKEGREALKAAAAEALKPEAAPAPQGSAEGGNGSAPAASETAGLPELREGAKILEECREPGACHTCKAPFPTKSRVPYEPGGRGEKGRTWGPGCCPVAEALLAQLAGSSS